MHEAEKRFGRVSFGYLEDKFKIFGYWQPHSFQIDQKDRKRSYCKWRMRKSDTSRDKGWGSCESFVPVGLDSGQFPLFWILSEYLVMDV